MEIERQEFIELYEVVAGLTLAQLELILRVCQKDDVRLEGIDLVFRQRTVLERWVSEPEKLYILCKHVTEEIIGKQQFFPKK